MGLLKKWRQRDERLWVPEDVQDSMGTGRGMPLKIPAARVREQEELEKKWCFFMAPHGLGAHCHKCQVVEHDLKVIQEHWKVTSTTSQGEVTTVDCIECWQKPTMTCEVEEWQRI